MAKTLRCLIVESEPADARDQRQASVGCTSAESYAETLKTLAACECVEVRPSAGEDALPTKGELEGYDAIFMTGSPLHLYKETPDTRRQVELMKSIFASGTPAFGSCAGLQVATIAAGGAVRPNASGREVAFARRILKTDAGRGHPLLLGRPEVYDAPTIHTDEVACLPDGATLLAGNRVTEVQAAEIRFDGGVFWGVQYHPELSLREIAAALRRQGNALIEEGFASGRYELEEHARLIELLDADPRRRDLAWRLGLDEQVTDESARTRELRNFIDLLVRPTKSRRSRA